MENNSTTPTEQGAKMKQTNRLTNWK